MRTVPSLSGLRIRPAATAPQRTLDDHGAATDRERVAPARDRASRPRRRRHGGTPEPEAGRPQTPVEDFLFTYYVHSPAQLRRWHPGPGVVLDGADDRDGWTFYRYVDGAIEND